MDNYSPGDGEPDDQTPWHLAPVPSYQRRENSWVKNGCRELPGEEEADWVGGNGGVDLARRDGEGGREV